MYLNSSNSKVGFTDPNSGAVYTSGVKSSGSSGMSLSSGSFGMGMSSGSSGMSMLSGSSNSMGLSGTSSSSVDIGQIKQQIQNIQSQLRQSSSQYHTDAANRLQDVYELLK